MGRRVTRPARSALALAAIALLFLTLAATAQARSYGLVAGDVSAIVAADGSVEVTERITVAFDGGFRPATARSLTAAASRSTGSP